MSIPTITPINELDDVSLYPSQANANFDNIRQSFISINNLLATTNNTLKLTNFSTLPQNSIEAATAVLTAATGTVFTVSPSGGASTLVIDALGNVTANKFIANGSGDIEKSVLNTVDVLEVLTALGDVEINSVLRLNGTDSKVVKKQRTITVADANLGGSATSLIDISNDDLIFLDFGNTTLTDGINFDLSNIEVGQEFEMVCLVNSPTGVNALYNGGSGTERFAILDPLGSGFQTIASAVQPAFVPGASPDGLSRLRVRFMDIGGGNLRLVVLEQKLVNGVD